MFVDETRVTLQQNDRWPEVTLYAARLSSPSHVISSAARHCDGPRKYLVTAPLDEIARGTLMKPNADHVECSQSALQTSLCPRARI